MATERITFGLSKGSVESAIRRIERLKIGYRRKLDRSIRLLAERGRDYLDGAYGTAGDYEGNVDISVLVEAVEKYRYRIIATGEKLFFLEYGTGVFASPDPNGFSKVDATPGSWSITHQRQFVTHGYWYYNGITFGSQPVHGFYYLGLAMPEIVREVVAEVFG